MDKLKFWGVRGSYPQCHKKCINYGGNTTCVSIEIANKLLIFDAGTGIIQLGNEMKDKYDEIHIFITHTHSDHIQGLSFFKPIYNKNKNVYIYGSSRKGKSFKEILATYFYKDYFPVDFCKSPGLKKVIEFDKVIKLGDEIKVEGMKSSMHPLYGVLVYKINGNIIFGTDIEWQGEYESIEKEKFIDFITGTDILLYDGTYREENYENYKGWGHSRVEDAIEVAKKSKIKDLYIVHYNPEDTDEILDEKSRYYKEKVEGIHFPKEGEWINI